MARHDYVTALGPIQDATRRGADQREMAAVVMLDQTAAFNLVDHEILIAVMRAMKFYLDTLEWFRSYLEGRWFNVKVESATSEPMAIGNHGVPQGSILGSLLFCPKPM